jgi:hypothetical protein
VTPVTGGSMSEGGTSTSRSPRAHGLLASSKSLVREVLASALASAWARCTPVAASRPPASMAPSDRLQRTMNLVMPLKRHSLESRGLMTMALVQATDEVLTGLNNIGTVHFARFDIVDGNLCMFSVFDGELTAYVRDFVATIGNAFDRIFKHLKDPPPYPVRLNVEEFVAWVQAHDAFQMPELPTDLITRDLTSLKRDTVVTLHRNPNVQLGVYRAYPGVSAAQVRHNLSVGW